MSFTRCSHALALTALLVLAFATSASAEPRTVFPVGSIQSVVPSASTVRVTLNVVLSPVRSAAACTGRVVVTVDLGGGRSVTESGRLSGAATGTCLATIRITLPRSREGRTVPFRLTYRGNAQIRRFDRTVRLRVRGRSAGSGSLNGTWKATEAGSTAAIYTFTVRDNMITAITQVQSYTLTCTRGTIALDGLSWNVPVAISLNPTGMSKTAGPVVGTAGDTTLTLSFVQFGASTGIGSAIGTAEKPGATGCPDPVSLQLLKA